MNSAAFRKFFEGAAYGAVVSRFTMVPPLGSPRFTKDKANKSFANKGFGFVQFTTKQAAQELIARKRIDVMGRVVRALAPSLSERFLAGSTWRAQ
jgi:hypothetical protein